MIHVVEVFQIKEEFADRVPELMQEMDDLVGPRTHDHPGFAGHATFFRHEADPNKVWILYPWQSHTSHVDLLSGELSILSEFQAKYCATPREIAYLSEIPHFHPEHE
jgi:Antibiotic biosynthesis monooxygenase